MNIKGRNILYDALVEHKCIGEVSETNSLVNCKFEELVDVVDDWVAKLVQEQVKL